MRSQPRKKLKMKILDFRIQHKGHMATFELGKANAHETYSRQVDDRYKK